MAKRVLMIGTDLDSKGGISSVLRMYRDGGLFEKVTFLASYKDGNIPDKIRHYLSFLGKYAWTLASQPDLRLVHIHSASYGSFLRKSLVIALARLAGKKALVHIHGAEFNVFYGKSPAPWRWIIRSLLKRCDAVIALSRQWKTDLERISGNPNVRVLYNPTVMQTPIFNNGAGHMQPQETVNFLFMGRLGQRKGVYDIIESARRIKANNVNIQLYGDGEIEHVQAAIEEKQVSDKVRVCGWIDGNRKDATFRQANVLLLPSYNEGLPISVLEAMAYGMPVITTDVGGIAEAVEDGVNGYLLNPGDHDRLADAMERLAGSPELRVRMGEEGYRMAGEKFALPVICRQLEVLYAELVE